VNAYLNTYLVSLLVSRIVPLLFATSAVLVLARVLTDRFISGRGLQKAAFAAIIVGGLLLEAPFALRSFFLVNAEWAMYTRHEDDAARAVAAFHRLGGRLGAWRASRWTGFLVHAQRWEEARELVRLALAENGSRDPSYTSDLRLVLAISNYYLGQWDAADESLRQATSSSPAFLYLRDYFRGRLSERRGDDTDAVQAYASSLQRDAGFLPALYQLTRLLLVRGEIAAARQVLDRFAGSPPRIPPPSAIQVLRESVAAGSVPPAKEFVIVLP
jgi:tetratricopeptide (TPR) repeat protein